MDTVEDLRDAARRARECAVIGQAVSLARWIGSGRRQVTPGRVLRKGDVPAAGAVLGVDVPAEFRSLAAAMAEADPEVLEGPMRSTSSTGSRCSTACRTARRTRQMREDRAGFVANADRPGRYAK